MSTTIQVSDEVKEELIEFLLYPRETHDEVLERVLELGLM